MKLYFKPKIVIDNTATGDHARDEREKLELTVQEVAEGMGYTISVLSKLELGHRNWTDRKVWLFNAALKELSKYNA